MHGWSPFTVRPRLPGQDRTVLVDTTQHLTDVEILSTPSAVRAQTGATLDQVLPLMKEAGLGLATTPATGNVTIGGCLAIGAHGAGVPGRGETRENGHTYGSMSNLVLSLTTVAWDRRKRRYALRTFDRDHPDCKALLVNLGRSFMTEATLRVGPDQKVRCVSFTDIPASRMFARPGSGGSDLFGDFVEEAGRAEAILFPFTERPWLKVWSLASKKPAGSRHVTEPYNYPFSDSVPPQVTNPAGRIVAGDSQITPAFGSIMYSVAAGGLAATGTSDIWGSGADVTRYIKATTLRYSELGYAVITARSRVQEVLSGFVDKVERLVTEYEARGLYPLNGPLELRVCGLDHGGHVGGTGTASPVLSAMRPHPRRPEWDAAVWLNVLTFAATPESQPFLRELERWILRKHRGAHSMVRPEWSKGWAHSGRTPWADRGMLTKSIPAAYRAGRRRDDDWDWAVARLDRYDPHHVFSNAFLDRLVR